MSWPPHITVATIVQRNDKFLFVEEREADRWVINQPAGHLESGETLFSAAIRETLEETACAVELTGVCGMYQYLSPVNNVLYHRIAFFAALIEELDQPLDRDIRAVHWLDINEMMTFEHRSPLVSQCVMDAIAAQTSRTTPIIPLSFIKHL